jgi:hypothetical protein
MIIKLTTPILVRGLIKYETITEIELRVPVVADLKGINFNDQDKLQDNFIMVIHRLSGLRIKDIERISLEDWSNIQLAFNKLAGIKK